ncbi:MAG: DUF998 domain-containing protein [Actinobacteria bacterium]|nr:DUF998 domain-containing protein [Actinomycetota bacterium]
MTRVGRSLLRCGAVACPLFVSVFLIEGAHRPDYRPLRHPVSSLALGPRGWVQVANFAATGMLYLAGAVGLTRSPNLTGRNRIAAAALGATGIGLLGSAAFRTDPVSGYPPGTPAVSAKTTTTGNLHTAAGMPIFLGIPAAAAAYAWQAVRGGRPGWAVYSAATTVAMLTGMGLAGQGFGQVPRLVNYAGLFQRAAIVAGFSWLSAVSARPPQGTAGHDRQTRREARWRRGGVPSQLMCNAVRIW